MRSSLGKMILVSALAIGAVAAVQAYSFAVWADDFQVVRVTQQNIGTSSAIVKVVVRNLESERVDLRVLVRANATTGGWVQGQTYGQLNANAQKEFAVRLNRPITQITLVQVNEVNEHGD